MKTYKKPTSIQINLTIESYMMDGSPTINPDGPVVGGEDDGSGGGPIQELTRRQSIWDNWND